MANDRRRRKMLAQLTRLREFEHRTAAGQAAQALARFAKIEQLARRAELLTQGAGGAPAAMNAQELSRQIQSTKRMREIAQETRQQAENARAIAQDRQYAERIAHKKLDQLRDKQAQLKARSTTEGYADQGDAGSLARNVNKKLASN